LTTSIGFSIPHQWFTYVHLFSTHLTFFLMPFLNHSLPWLYTTAALSGLKPAFESRFRRTYLHLIYSSRSSTW